jgi:hypothetical protein
MQVFFLYCVPDVPGQRPAKQRQSEMKQLMSDLNAKVARDSECGAAVQISCEYRLYSRTEGREHPDSVHSVVEALKQAGDDPGSTTPPGVVTSWNEAMVKDISAEVDGSAPRYLSTVFTI